MFQVLVLPLRLHGLDESLEAVDADTLLDPGGSMASGK